MTGDAPSPVPDGQAVPALPYSSAIMIHAPGGFSMALPSIIADAGEDAAVSVRRNASSKTRDGVALSRPCRA